MLTVIEGPIGAGKTLYMVSKALLTKRPIVANLTLKNIDYEKFSIHKFVSGNYDGNLVLLDEIWSIADARFSMSNQNASTTHQLFQSRKSNLDIYGTLQIQRSVDVRFREMADKIVIAMGLRKVKSGYAYKYNIFYNNRKYVRYINIKWAESEIYHCYATKQKISSHNVDLSQFKSRKEQILDIFDYADKIEEHYSKTKEKITRVDIDNYLYFIQRLEKYSKALVNRIYVVIKKGKEFLS